MGLGDEEEERVAILQQDAVVVDNQNAATEDTTLTATKLPVPSAPPASGTPATASSSSPSVWTVAWWAALPAKIIYRVRHISRRDFLLLFYLLGVIASGTFNRVTFKMMGNAMGKNYSFFLTNVTTFVYIPIFFALVLYKLIFTKHITKEMRRFGKWKFLIMGFFDATASIFIVFGNYRVSGPLQQLLLQGVIPLTMIFSFIFLKMRYRILQYIGAVIILGGIFFSLFPKLFFNQDAQNDPLWAVLFFANNIPNALSGVYKEFAFKSQPMDIYWLNAWVSLWQFIVGLIYFPVNLIPMFGGYSLKDIPYTLWYGILCLFGQNNLEGDTCHLAFIPVCAYLFFNILYNIFLLLVLKHGSAALMYIASTVILPLGNVVFTIRYIPFTNIAVFGDKAASLSFFDIAGLLIILTGLIIYRSFGAKSDTTESKAGTEVIPIFNVNTGDVVHPVRHQDPDQPPPLIAPRSSQQIRSSFYTRLGLDQRGPPLSYQINMETELEGSDDPENQL